MFSFNRMLGFDLRPVHTSRESECEAKFVTSTMVHGKYSRRRFAKVQHISTCANNLLRIWWRQMSNSLRMNRALNSWYFHGIRPGANFIELLSREFCLANIFAKHFKTHYQPKYINFTCRLGWYPRKSAKQIFLVSNFLCLAALWNWPLVPTGQLGNHQA